MPKNSDAKLVAKAVLTLRMLAVDAIERANSGHPGAAMGLADVAYEIWARHLRHDPRAPGWPNRDRFILSCGHASALLYALLHLSGYELSLDEVRSFRQLGSLTPGHPEAHRTPGVDATTGPLGQGLGNAVGLAAGIKMLAARFHQHEPELFTARVFGLCSDGDIMEGLSSEAASLAGHLGLGNIIFVYDRNSISIDGPISLSLSEDVGSRFRAQGWHVQDVDGHDHEQIREALDDAVAETERPSLIMAVTHIGMGSPSKQDSELSHGAPLGAAEVKLMKESLGWPLEPAFHVPDEVRALFARLAEAGAERHRQWQAKRDRLIARGGAPAALYQQLTERRVPEDIFAQLCAAAPVDQKGPTRAHAGVVQQRAAALVPSLAGGCADLTPSVKTYIKGEQALAKGRFEGRNVHFGVREHAMGAFVNGLAYTGAFIPYGSTFMVFSDYMRPAIRIAAISRLQSIFVFSHDSVLVGEDGPTHQPVEHFLMLRAVPNVDLVRPADALECAAAWTHALRRTDGPTALALTRQAVPPLERPDDFDPAVMLRGAYVLAAESAPEPDVVIIATGSEVWIALGARKILEQEGIKTRVVSAPCLEQLERQDRSYRAQVLPPGVRRVSLELGLSWPWRSVVGLDGLPIGLDEFGVSAPNEVLRRELGFTPEAVAQRIRSWL